MRHRNALPVALAPTPQKHGPPCTWCGLRLSRGKLVLGAPTCNECFDGGRKARSVAYAERLRRAGNGLKKGDTP